MKITRGIATGCVVQQNRRTRTARVQVDGSCTSSGPVTAQIKGLRQTWRGRADRGLWRINLTGLPVGGPYTITFSLGPARCVVRQVYVGDLWVLAGQSNIVGDGVYDEPENPIGPVRVYDKDSLWRMAADPLESLRQRPSIGLGMTFAKTLYRMTKTPIGLIPAARGASCMAQWHPQASVKPPAEPLYAAMQRRVNECGGQVAGVLWYQGESDATTAYAAAYEKALADHFAHLRQDFGKRLPVLYVQIGRVLSFANDPNLSQHTAQAWDQIRAIQYSMFERLKNVSMTTAVDLELDNKIHHSSRGLKILGGRLALLAARQVHGIKGIQPGPRIDAMRTGVEAQRPFVDLICTGVNGTLRANGRPSGFSVFHADGSENPVVKTRLLTPNTIRLFLNEPLTQGSVWHGRGTDPYCNIEDERGLALCATGPMIYPTI
jgi:hypothetical protein